MKGAHKRFSRVVAAAFNYAGMANWQMPKPDANGCWDILSARRSGRQVLEGRSRVVFELMCTLPAIGGARPSWQAGFVRLRQMPIILELVTLLQDLETVLPSSKHEDFARLTALLSQFHT